MPKIEMMIQKNSISAEAKLKFTNKDAPISNEPTRLINGNAKPVAFILRNWVRK